MTTTATKEQAIRDLGAERAIADTATRSKPVTRKWSSTCGHSKFIVVGSMEYEDAEQHGWSYCNRTACKDTLPGQWADAPRKGEIVNGKTTPKATTKKATRKPTAAKAAKNSTASRARKAADSLPNKVRQHREAASLSPKELAQRLGTDWTASTVRRIERGARKATPQQIAQLADALGVPSADLGFAAEPLPQVPAEKSGKAAKPAPKPAAKGGKGKPVGKRTGKVIDTTQAFTDEVSAILAG